MMDTTTEYTRTKQHEDKIMGINEERYGMLPNGPTKLNPIVKQLRRDLHEQELKGRILRILSRDEADRCCGKEDNNSGIDL